MARIIEIYDTTDHTDPSNPIDKKGIVYVDRSGIQQIAFTIPERLDEKIKEIRDL